MSSIIVDAELHKRIIELKEPVDLVDPSGKRVGRFVPAAMYPPAEALIPPISEEELDRRERSNERRYTSAEMMQQLEKLL